MNVVLGITGSIAAFKALELIRLLKRNGADVKVILTAAARHFVTSLSCQTLSENEVYRQQFVLTSGIKHLSLSDWGDILVIAPATANIIGKAAAGIGDDLLSTTLLSFPKPMLFVPAMDSAMWQNALLEKNVDKLKKSGVHFLEPVVGSLASGKIGKGRFPDITLIYKKILTVLAGYKMLNSKKFIITGGRTEEDFDPVRVITNRSSGKMARELLYAVLCRSGQALGIFGETNIVLPDSVPILKARTSSEMLNYLKKHIKWCDCLIMAAAVGDYKPVKIASGKIHSNRLTVVLKKNQDILATLYRHKGDRYFIGFSVEDQRPRQRAAEKLLRKKLDLIVLNSSKAIGRDKTEAWFLNKTQKIIKCGKVDKWELAHKILDVYSKDMVLQDK